MDPGAIRAISSSIFPTRLRGCRRHSARPARLRRRMRPTRGPRSPGQSHTDSRSATMAEPAANWWFSPGAAGCLASAECTVTPQVGLLSGTATWRVQAWTVNGHRDWTAPITLSVSFSGAREAGARLPDRHDERVATVRVERLRDRVAVLHPRVRPDGPARRSMAHAGRAPGAPAATGTCSTNAGVTLSTGAGYWEVIAWNNSDYSPWSGTTAFVVP